VPNPFSVRAAGLASVTAGGLILLNQLSQLILVYTVTESFWTGTHVYRRGLALIAMYVLLIALTALYSLEANVMGNLGLIGYLIAFLGTMLVAGDWWYETFIVPKLMEWSPELMDEPNKWLNPCRGIYDFGCIRGRVVDLRIFELSGRGLSSWRLNPHDVRRSRGCRHSDRRLANPIGYCGRMDRSVADPVGQL